MTPHLEPRSTTALYISICPKTSSVAKESFPVWGVSSFYFSCGGSEVEILRKYDKFYSLECPVFLIYNNLPFNY